MHQQERQALKKLENIRLDHSQRLVQLQQDQNEDRRKGEIIEMNSVLVEKALTMIRSAVANQVKSGFAPSFCLRNMALIPVIIQSFFTFFADNVA